MLGRADIELHRVAVGDRYILEKMRNDGFNLGGEPSGHILMTDFARSGDGLLTALQMLTLLKGSTKKASRLFNSFRPNPQRLKNLTGIDPIILQREPLQAAIREVEAGLGGRGRVLVRPSGTEPLIRVMVEAESEPLLSATMDALTLCITEEADKNI
jgi:phosphoglucosamine mutase